MYFTLTPVFTILLGVMLLFTGMLFKVMHWPDMFQGLYSGWAVILAGLIWLFVKRKKLREKEGQINQ